MHRRGKESDEAGESLRARRPVLGQCRIVEAGRGAANKIDGSSWTSAALSRIYRGSKTQLPLFGQPARSTTLATKFSRRHNPACVFHQSTGTGSARLNATDPQSVLSCSNNNDEAPSSHTQLSDSAVREQPSLVHGKYSRVWSSCPVDNLSVTDWPY